MHSHPGLKHYSTEADTSSLHSSNTQTPLTFQVGKADLTGSTELDQQNSLVKRYIFAPGHTKL